MSRDSNGLRVSALIVNYNSGVHAVECIASLLRQTAVELDIIVVDNASRDDSVDILRTTFGERITLIESRENLGFGRANNLAAASAHGDILLLINPDAVLLEETAVATLADFLSENLRIGIVGPQIHEPSKRKYVLPRRRYPSESRLKHTSKLKALPGEYAWILGACMMLRKPVYDQLGGFDPDYFLYGEDIDICLRARLAGYSIAYCPSAKITHIGGASEQSSPTLEKFLRKKRGFFLFCKKHYDARDVTHIARMSLMTTFFKRAQLVLRRLLGFVSPSDYLGQKHRLDAESIVAREALSKN
jgi:GT2 family glycosyltransferase